MNKVMDILSNDRFSLEFNKDEEILYIRVGTTHLPIDKSICTFDPNEDTIIEYNCNEFKGFILYIGRFEPDLELIEVDPELKGMIRKVNQYHIGERPSGKSKTISYDEKTDTFTLVETFKLSDIKWTGNKTKEEVVESSKITKSFLDIMKKKERKIKEKNMDEVMNQVKELLLNKDLTTILKADGYDIVVKERLPYDIVIKEIPPYERYDRLCIDINGLMLDVHRFSFGNDMVIEYNTDKFRGLCIFNRLYSEITIIELCLKGHPYTVYKGTYNLSKHLIGGLNNIFSYDNKTDTFSLDKNKFKLDDLERIHSERLPETLLTGVGFKVVKYYTVSDGLNYIEARLLIGENKTGIPWGLFGFSHKLQKLTLYKTKKFSGFAMLNLFGYLTIYKVNSKLNGKVKRVSVYGLKYTEGIESINDVLDFKYNNETEEFTLSSKTLGDTVFKLEDLEKRNK